MTHNTHTTITAPRKRSAKTLGLAAAGVAAAGALLLPAVGTFSLWQADAGLGSGFEGITAGLLSVGVEDGTWAVRTADGTLNPIENPGQHPLAPGETLVYSANADLASFAGTSRAEIVVTEGAITPVNASSPLDVALAQALGSTAKVTLDTADAGGINDEDGVLIIDSQVSTRVGVTVEITMPAGTNFEAMDGRVNVAEGLISIIQLTE